MPSTRKLNPDENKAESRTIVVEEQRTYQQTLWKCVRCEDCKGFDGMQGCQHSIRDTGVEEAFELFRSGKDRQVKRSEGVRGEAIEELGKLVFDDRAVVLNDHVDILDHRAINALKYIHQVRQRSSKGIESKARLGNFVSLGPGTCVVVYDEGRDRLVTRKELEEGLEGDVAADL